MHPVTRSLMRRKEGLQDGTVIVSDGAGQFRIAEHALCWVHAEHRHNRPGFCSCYLET